ncbi:hypothetical protein L596_030638 [Steinernema carpocapsae]|uniref:Uncharacterized protein n=1 Tax=Steinernema carpocapsae TaxID=34508 RepID=A0A4U5LQ10_STECR|nr:hypothetical protein L596_030638 [Steinernema carpocapsae]
MDFVPFEFIESVIKLTSSDPNSTEDPFLKFSSYWGEYALAQPFDDFDVNLHFLFNPPLYVQPNDLRQILNIKNNRNIYCRRFSIQKYIFYRAYDVLWDVETLAKITDILRKSQKPVQEVQIAAETPQFVLEYFLGGLLGAAKLCLSGFDYLSKPTEEFRLNVYRQMLHHGLPYFEIDYLPSQNVGSFLMLWKSYLGCNLKLIDVIKTCDARQLLEQILGWWRMSDGHFDVSFYTNCLGTLVEIRFGHSSNAEKSFRLVAQANFNVAVRIALR